MEAFPRPAGPTRRGEPLEQVDHRIAGGAARHLPQQQRVHVGRIVDNPDERMIVEVGIEQIELSQRQTHRSPL